jgi:hypothetical protein
LVSSAIAAVFFRVSSIAYKLVLLQQNSYDVFGCQLRQRLVVKANGQAGDTKRISETVRESIKSYERRMRVFNLEIVVVALMVLAILIIWLSDTWVAFEKSLGLAF